MVSSKKGAVSFKTRIDLARYHSNKMDVLPMLLFLVLLLKLLSVALQFERV